MAIAIFKGLSLSVRERHYLVVNTEIGYSLDRFFVSEREESRESVACRP